MFRHAAYVDGVSGSSRTAVQLATACGLVVEPVVRLAEAEQRRGGDHRVVEADDAIEVQAGLGEVARGEQLAAALEHRQRRISGESPARARVERSGRRRGVVHRPDDTRLAGMCGRFTQQRPASELAEIFGAEPLIDDPGERYNVAPTDEAAVVVQREDRRAVTAYRWGLIPHWAKEAKVGSRMFNARAETITTSPAFRDAFVRKRCLVPVDSFYEWKREGTIRQPYRVVRRDGAPLALAGLWAGWRDPATETVRRTFTIITTTPNEALADLHDRMPVVIDEDAWDRWLDPSPRGSRRAPRPARPERGRRARRLRGRALRQRRAARRPRADRAARLRP